MSSRVRLGLLAVFATAGSAFAASTPPSLDEVSARVGALEARLARIEKALGITETTSPTTDPLPEAVQGLRSEVAALRSQVEATPKADAPRPAPAPMPAATPTVNSKWTTTIYGYVKLDAIYDTQKTAVGDAAFYVLPETGEGPDDEFNMTARESRVGLRIGAPKVGELTPSGVFEFDFYGGGSSANSPVPRLRLAYADLAVGDWAFRLGQDWETFITVVPKTVDFALLGDQGAIGLRRAQFRATRRIVAEDKSAWEGRLAIARTIGQDIDGGGQDDGVDAGLPTLQWNFLHERPSGFKAGISGHWGDEDVEQGNTGIHDTYSSWSAIGSLVLPVSSKASFQGSLWTGSNLDTYFGGVGQGINRSFGRAIDAQGGFLQLVLNPTPKLNINFTAGIDDADDDDLSAGMRSANKHLSTSLFYQWTPAIRTAVSLTDLNTEYYLLEDARTLRLHTALYFGF